MAETPNAPQPIINPLNPPQEDLAAKNAEVARKLAAQGADSPENANKNEFSAAGGALDDLAKQAEEAGKKKAEEAAAIPPKVEPVEVKPAESGTPSAEPDPIKQKAEEMFKESPTLPPNASPKSHEAFESIKVKAAQDISALNEKLEAVNKQLAEFQRQSKDGNPEVLELRKQNQDLQARLAKLDVDVDPKFKTFDDKIKSTKDYVYDQLKQAGVVDDAVIKEMEKYGGPHKVKLEKVFEAIKGDEVLSSVVKAKVADLMATQYEKDKAIQQTKQNIEQYQKERGEFFQNASGNHTKAATALVDKMMGEFDWNKPVAVDDKMTPEQRKSAEETNKFLSETSAQVREALNDDSPEMRAILIAGTAQLFQLQRVHAATKAEAEGLRKQLGEATAKLEKIKNSSRSRLSESAAPPSGQMPKPKVDVFTSRPGDALDALAKQVSDERAARLT